MPRGAPDFYKVMREKGVETRLYRRTGSLGAGESETLVDIPDADVTIEHLEFASNHNDATLFIYPYKSDGTLDKYSGVLFYDGSGVADINPEQIHVNESISWTELIYDLANQRFKFGLRYPIRFCNGVRIMVLNADVTAKRNVACEVLMTRRW